VKLEDELLKWHSKCLFSVKHESTWLFWFFETRTGESLSYTILKAKGVCMLLYFETD